MNLLKTHSLIFGDSQAEITLQNDEDDMVTISISQLDVNEEKSTKNNEVLEPISTTEINLGVNEVERFIEALEFILPKERVNYYD